MIQSITIKSFIIFWLQLPQLYRVFTPVVPASTNHRLQTPASALVSCLLRWCRNNLLRSPSLGWLVGMDHNQLVLLRLSQNWTFIFIVPVKSWDQFIMNNGILRVGQRDVESWWEDTDVGPSQDTHWILFQLLIRGFVMNLQTVSRSQVIGYCVIKVPTKLYESIITFSSRSNSRITVVRLSVILLPEFLKISLVSWSWFQNFPAFQLARINATEYLNTQCAIQASSYTK